MFSEKTPELIKTLDSDREVLHGHIDLPKVYLPRNAESVTRRLNGIRDRVNSITVMGAAEKRLRECFDVMIESFAGDVKNEFCDYYKQILDRWNKFLTGCGARNKEGIDDAWNLALIEALANAIEHGSERSNVELQTIITRSQIAVIITNEIDGLKLPHTQQSIEKMSRKSEEYATRHYAIDEEDQKDTKLRLVRALQSDISNDFRTLSPEGETLSFPAPSFYYRGNASVQLAVSRMNFSWRAINGHTFEQYILLSSERYATIEKELEI
jgi:hypothetical protein